MEKIDILYSLRGDPVPARVARSGRMTLVAALRWCSDVANLPAGTIHYCITTEEGVTLWDTRRDGLIIDATEALLIISGEDG